MKEEEIIEGNKLIAEFMGERVNKYHKSTFPENMKYHSSWDWLMPVVKKLNDIFEAQGRELSNHSRDQEHLDNQLDNPLHWKSWSYHHVHLDTDINEVYAELVESLKWYNSQKQEQESNR